MADKPETLWWHETGPLLGYKDGTLYIEDLNPQAYIRWSMQPRELFRIGLRCIWVAVKNWRPYHEQHPKGSRASASHP